MNIKDFSKRFPFVVIVTTLVLGTILGKEFNFQISKYEYIVSLTSLLVLSLFLLIRSYKYSYIICIFLFGYLQSLKYYTPPSPTFVNAQHFNFSVKELKPNYAVLNMTNGNETHKIQAYNKLKLNEGDNGVIHATINPKINFPYFNHIGIKGKVYLTEENTSVKNTTDASLRSKIKKWIISNTFSTEYSPISKALTVALLTGDRSFIKNEEKEAFQSLGIMHVLAISGLHISILYLLISFSLKRLHLTQNHPLISFLIAILLLWFYAYICSFSHSVVRACIMFSIFLLNDLIKRNYSIINTLLFSAFICLVICPGDLFQAGFQLSYGAVFGIILFVYPYKYTYYHPNKIIRTLCNYIIQIPQFSIGVQLFIAPILIFHFGEISNYSLLHNMVVIPLISVYYILSLISVVPFINDIALFSNNFLASVFMKYLSAVNNFPNPTTSLEITPFQIILYYMIVIFVFLAISQRKKSFLFLSLIVISFLSLSRLI